MNKKKNQKNTCFPRGSIAVFTLFLMVILTIVTIGVITTATTERKVSISTGNSTTAFQIAESGMEDTLQNIKSNFSKSIEGSWDNCGEKSVTDSVCGNVSVGYVRNNISSIDDNEILFKTNNPDDNCGYAKCANNISEIKTIKSIGTTKQETRAIEQDVFLGATKLLLHFNECATDAGATCTDFIPDSSYYYNKYIGKIKLNGDAKTETTADETHFPIKLGEGIVKFGGEDGYIYIPNFNDGDWNFGVGDFTIDFWIRTAVSNPENKYIEIGFGENALSIYQKNSDLCFSIGIFDFCKPFIPAITPFNNTEDIGWEHIAFVRKGGDVKFFMNGIKTDPADYLSEINITEGGIFIGSSSVPNNFFEGYMDELRISKGVARWWEDNFDLPTDEYRPD